MQKKKFIPFGGHGSSSNKDNDTYCAKFARGVAKEVGMDWNWYSLTGEASVNDVVETYEVTIIELKNFYA